MHHIRLCLLMFTNVCENEHNTAINKNTNNKIDFYQKATVV
jgi:hypothetical protein